MKYGRWWYENVGYLNAWSRRERMESLMWVGVCRLGWLWWELEYALIKYNSYNNGSEQNHHPAGLHLWDLPTTAVCCISVLQRTALCPLQAQLLLYIRVRVHLLHLRLYLWLQILKLSAMSSRHQCSQCRLCLVLLPDCGHHFCLLDLSCPLQYLPPGWPVHQDSRLHIHNSRWTMPGMFWRVLLSRWQVCCLWCQLCHMHR